MASHQLPRIDRMRERLSEAEHSLAKRTKPNSTEEAASLSMLATHTQSAPRGCPTVLLCFPLTLLFPLDVRELFAFWLAAQPLQVN